MWARAMPETTLLMPAEASGTTRWAAWDGRWMEVMGRDVMLKATLYEETWGRARNTTSGIQRRLPSIKDAAKVTMRELTEMMQRLAARVT